MTVRLKERELAAVGISAAAGCKPCTVHHVAAARKARASDEEIRRAVADALRIRRSATQIIADHALSQLGGRAHDRAPGRGGETDRIAELVCVGAAFGVNCVSNLAKHIAAAESVGISRAEIAEIAKLAAFIKRQAASHVERMVGMTGAENEEDEAAEPIVARNSALGGD